MDGSATRAWWSEMKAIAARYGRRAPSDAAEDLAQDLAVAALEEGRDAAERPAAWLQRVGRNAAIDRWRAERRHGELRGAVAAPSGTPDPEAALLGREQRRVVRRALLALPRPQRQAALLRFHCDLPFDAVAARLGTEPATARTRVHRALAGLRARVQGLRALFFGWTGTGAPAAALGLALLATGTPTTPGTPRAPGALAQSGPQVAPRARRQPQTQREQRQVDTRPTPPAAVEARTETRAPAIVAPSAPARHPPADQVPSRQIFIFDPDSITGDTTGPDGEIVRIVPPILQPSLIEIRRHFVPEMIKALEEL